MQKVSTVALFFSRKQDYLDGEEGEMNGCKADMRVAYSQTGKRIRTPENHGQRGKVRRWGLGRNKDFTGSLVEWAIFVWVHPWQALLIQGERGKRTSRCCGMHFQNDGR